jgi:hypothetical protein
MSLAPWGQIGDFLHLDQGSFLGVQQLVKFSLRQAILRYDAEQALRFLPCIVQYLGCCIHTLSHDSLRFIEILVLDRFEYFLHRRNPL